MRYFKNTSWLFVEKILRIFVGLFIGVWIARYLGPEQFGLFSYAQNLVALFSSISTLGLNNIIVRELLKDKNNQNEIIATSFFLKLFGAFLVLVLLALSIDIFSKDSDLNFLIFIIASSVVFQSFNVVDFYFQSKVLSKYIVYVNTISLFLSSIIKIVLIMNEAPLIYFAFVVLFDNIILAIGFIYVFVKKSELDISDLVFKMKVAISLLKNSLPLIFSILIVAIYMRIDLIMIKDFIGLNAVGQYTASIRLSEAWYFIPIIITNSVFPAILNAKQNNKKLYYQRIQKLYDLMVVLAIGIAIPITFFSDWLVAFLYGNEYNEVKDVLIIHIWTVVFSFLGTVSTKWFISEDLQKYLFYRTLYGAFINIGLNYILIPLYGIYGAAVATLISQIVTAYLFNLTNKKFVYNFKLQTNSILLPFRILGVKFG